MEKVVQRTMTIYKYNIMEVKMGENGPELIQLSTVVTDTAVLKAKLMKSAETENPGKQIFIADPVVTSGVFSMPLSTFVSNATWSEKTPKAEIQPEQI